VSGATSSLGTGIYRGAASLTAWRLCRSPIVESVLAHRSVATGEVCFGRSDIDLLVFLRPEAAHDGERLAALYDKVRLCRRLNPALGHMEVHGRGGWQSWLETDTYWGALETRSALPLCGKPVARPHRPVNPDHAIRNFAIWVEGFFSIAVQQRSRRNLRKTVLESWNAYAAATGLIAEPYVRRDETELHWRRLEKTADWDGITGEPGPAAGHVFELAERLHRRFLPPLRPLPRPLVYQALLPPRLRRRTLVVLPRPGAPLPAEAFTAGAFLCTPEALDLFLHYANAFLYWTLPTELLAAGMQPPAPGEFVRSCRYYGQNHFLRNPGFINQAAYTPLAVAACWRHALDWLSRGEVPPPLPRAEIDRILTAVPRCGDYYRRSYAQVWREVAELKKMTETLAER
jgi:hypothetical protein